MAGGWDGGWAGPRTCCGTGSRGRRSGCRTSSCSSCSRHSWTWQVGTGGGSWVHVDALKKQTYLSEFSFLDGFLEGDQLNLRRLRNRKIFVTSERTCPGSGSRRRRAAGSAGGLGDTGRTDIVTLLATTTKRREQIRQSIGHGFKQSEMCQPSFCPCRIKLFLTDTRAP